MSHRTISSQNLHMHPYQSFGPNMGREVEGKLIACQACAKAKTKCDKEEPSCSRCISKNLNCVVRHSKRPPGSAAVHGPGLSAKIRRSPVPIVPQPSLHPQHNLPGRFRSHSLNLPQAAHTPQTLPQSPYPARMTEPRTLHPPSSGYITPPIGILRHTASPVGQSGSNYTPITAPQYTARTLITSQSPWSSTFTDNILGYPSPFAANSQDPVPVLTADDMQGFATPMPKFQDSNYPQVPSSTPSTLASPLMCPYLAEVDIIQDDQVLSSTSQAWSNYGMTAFMDHTSKAPCYYNFENQHP